MLAARLMACRGRVQKVGEVVHLIAAALFDRSGLLARIGEETPSVPRSPEPGPGPGRSTLRVHARNFR